MDWNCDREGQYVTIQNFRLQCECTMLSQCWIGHLASIDQYYMTEYRSLMFSLKKSTEHETIIIDERRGSMNL